MEARSQTLLVGLISGLIQGNILLTVCALLTSHALETVDLVPAWEIATISLVSISFVVGIILADMYDTVKAVLLALVVALGFSMPLVNLLGISITVSPEQGYAEASFFGLLTPAVFFVGIMLGLAASWLREFSPVGPLRPLNRRTRNAVIVLSIVLAGILGAYEFSIVAAPNYTISAPTTLSVKTTCFYNQTCAVLVIGFNATVNPVRGYTGNVKIFWTAFAPYDSRGYCFPAPIHLPDQTSSFCQANARYPPGTYQLHYRATDGNIIHDIYVQVIVN